MDANGRRRENLIHSLQTSDGICYLHHGRAQEIYNHFGTHFGPSNQSDLTPNWDEVRLGRRDLSHLEDDFTEEEVFAVIKDLARDKARGPTISLDFFSKQLGILSRMI
jgi:hypothetical protein